MEMSNREIVHRYVDLETPINILAELNAVSISDIQKVLRDEGVDIVGGQTENHVFTIDLRKFDKTGKDVANLLEEVHITANKNTVPNDPASPFVTSGLRVGTPAVTTRGFKEPEMLEIAKVMGMAAKNWPACKEEASARIAKLAKDFPIKAFEA